MGNVANKVAEVVSEVVLAVATFFSSSAEGLKNTLMSATEIHFAPISVVLDKNHASYLLDRSIVGNE